MNYRQTKNAYCNCNKRIYRGIGPYDIPEMYEQEFDLEDFEILGFNYAKGEDLPDNKICHFYIDDYQFVRVWNYPDQYIDLMKSFRAVLAPDFSIYEDFPVVVNLFNHYRKQWVARYWQDHGVKVIPTICWGDEASYEWCFTGTPKNATISISTVGCNANDGRDYWSGFNKAIEVLQPKRILLFTTPSPIKIPETGAEIIRVINKNIANVRGSRKYKEIDTPNGEVV